jgi:hypothetical protein
MKTSQLKSIFAFLLLAAITFTSCKKDDPAPQDPIVGSWIGKYSTGNVQPATFYSFNILPNGVLQIRDFNKAVIGSGTWKLEDQTFYGVYTYEGGDTYNLAAKYEAADGTITGSWGEGETNADDGEFFLNKE